MCEEKKVTYANQVQIHALKCIMQLGLPFQACNSSPKSLSFFFYYYYFSYKVHALVQSFGNKKATWELQKKLFTSRVTRKSNPKPPMLLQTGKIIVPQ